jgi:hypothetical protein
MTYTVWIIAFRGGVAMPAYELSGGPFRTVAEAFDAGKQEVLLLQSPQMQIGFQIQDSMGNLVHEARAVTSR